MGEVINENITTVYSSLREFMPSSQDKKKPNVSRGYNERLELF